MICDFRGHGNSEGQFTTFGIKEAEDIKAVYDWIKIRHPQSPVYALAYSMGGAAVIRAAAKYNIFNKIVLDSSFARSENVARQTILKIFGPFSSVFWQMGRFWGWVWTGVDIADSQPERDITSLANRPIMIIHGTKDSMIPYTESLRLYEATGKRAKLWLVENMDHVQSLMSPEYKKRIKEFFEGNDQNTNSTNETN